MLSDSTERCDGARTCEDCALCLFDCRIRGFARRCGQSRVMEDLSVFFWLRNILTSLSIVVHKALSVEARAIRC